MDTVTVTSSSLAIIVDYNNAIKIPEGDNFNSQLLSKLSEIINIAISQVTMVNDIDIRLYGGWYEDGLFTAAASKISQAIESEDFFPIPVAGQPTLIRGTIELTASSIASPMKRWPTLFKQGSGTPRLQICPGLETSICDANLSICPIHVVKRFSKGPKRICSVDGCTRANADVFRQARQKKVDVMMAADIVSAASGNYKPYQAVTVFTDDTDLYPAILDAAASQTRIVLFKTRQGRGDIETELLENEGVIVRMVT